MPAMILSTASLANPDYDPQNYQIAHESHYDYTRRHLVDANIVDSSMQFIWDMLERRSSPRCYNPYPQRNNQQPQIH